MINTTTLESVHGAAVDDIELFDYLPEGATVDTLIRTIRILSAAFRNPNTPISVCSSANDQGISCHDIIGCLACTGGFILSNPSHVAAGYKPRPRMLIDAVDAIRQYFALHVPSLALDEVTHSDLYSAMSECIAARSSYEATQRL